MKIYSKQMKLECNNSYFYQQNKNKEYSKSNRSPFYLNNQYIQKHKDSIRSSHINRKQKQRFSSFFINLQQNGKLYYEKVQVTNIVPSHKRKLQFFLSDNGQFKAKNDYEFSFKKKENGQSHNQSNSKIKTQYNHIKVIKPINFYPNSPKQNINYQKNTLLNQKTVKIRKFNSLANMKSSQIQQNEQKISAQHPKIITSVVKKQTSLNKISRFHHKRIQNHKTQASLVDYNEIQEYNAQQIKPNTIRKNFDVNQKMKTESYLQKLKLHQIRKQLFEVYVTKKQEYKLKQ